MVSVENGGQHEEPRLSKRKRPSANEIMPRKRLRASATSKRRVLTNSGGPFSTKRRERGPSTSSSKVPVAQSGGNYETIAEQGRHANAKDNDVFIADHHDAEKEACEGDESCYICDDGGGR